MSGGLKMMKDVNSMSMELDVKEQKTICLHNDRDVYIRRI